MLKTYKFKDLELNKMYESKEHGFVEYVGLNNEKKCKFKLKLDRKLDLCIYCISKREISEYLKPYFVENKWHHVKESLPEISNFEKTNLVLVCDSKNNMYIAYLMQIDEETEPQWYENGRDGYYAKNILFWTELPESPLKK